MGLKPSAAVYYWALKPSAGNFERLFFDCIVKTCTRKKYIHLVKVISERFQSHFSEYALMILK